MERYEEEEKLCIFRVFKERLLSMAPSMALAEKTICPHIKELFKQVAGVHFHIYQGRIRTL